MSVLRIEGVGKRFGAIDVLRDVTLSVEPGTITALIGPNGAGKSTLANVVSGYERSQRGRVFLADRDVTRLPVHRRAALGIGRTFQNLELFEELTAADNVLMGSYARHRLRWLSGPGGAGIAHGSPNQWPGLVLPSTPQSRPQRSRSGRRRWWNRSACSPPVHGCSSWTNRPRG
ncbi:MULTISPECIES: ATP-binding cassette domain-containing protein [Amycolatopsis methanolica group]|uniref:ATP-binding cassette domain-containing protein n=1 Tax=Amycolatopsis methanolica group TaxID=2893674 RepID=UPI00343AD1DA